MANAQNFTRRGFLLSGTAGLAAPLIAAPQRKRNVLFIASDDLNNCLSCYGHPMVRTPNIDRIAKMGVRFDKSYCQFPLCSPSRTSLMTGLSPDTTRVYNLQKHFRETLPDVVTLGQLFQKNGYFSGRVGKIFHYGVPRDIGTAGLDDKPTWNQAINPSGVDHNKEEALLTVHTPTRGIGSSIGFHASQARDDEHTDGMVANEVIRMIEQHRNEPFFVGAGFYRPHVPWIAPSKYFDMYPLAKIETIPFEQSELTMAPEWAYFTNPANWGLSDLQRREAMRAYYASISFMDAQVGKLLDALDRMRLAQDTTVVFWGDNGYQLGEHGQWMKQTVFENAARIPMLIGGAGVEARGKGCGRTVELLDLYPTLADLCGLRGTPTNLQGRSLKPLLTRADAAWDRPAITQVQRGAGAKGHMGHSLRTERYRYTRWSGTPTGEELYDYQTDPRETQNLASNPKMSAIKNGLDKRLGEILKTRQPA